ncbi:MAG: toll/interleukin-1 receptor domain-containing protein [Chitinophagaceae bacterium]|nr:toll/interleukin-1 receptor domain-containing protein [Chitinophagaceae bacterium]
MLTLKRLAVYFITFIVSVALVIGFVNWKWLDKYLVNEANKISSDNELLNKEIVFINLEKQTHGSEAESFKLFRKSIIKLLNTIAGEAKDKKGPKGVVLDIWFSNDTTELENLKAALKQLKDLKVPVYASYNINEKHESIDLEKIDFSEVEDKHAIDLYNDYLAGADGKNPGSGRYHTFFYPEKNVANYENDIYLKSLIFDSVLIESLARKVTLDLSNSQNLSRNPKRGGSIVPYGNLAEIENKTFTFIADSTRSAGVFQSPSGVNAPIDINKNILVVGDAENDLVDIGTKKIPGPYIVTWALSDLLDNNNRLKLPIENLAVIIGQILFFSFFTVLIFALLFKYIKKLQTKPAVIAAIAFAASMIFFFIYGRLILGFNYVIPAGHTIVASIIAALLCWRFAHKFLVTGVAEGSQKYDVFISYSHSQSDWVYKNVYEPLATVKKANGEKLNIFFDKKSIGFGEAFTAKYMWAIVDAKNFLAVISEDYYGKNHCRNELDCAVKRKVEKLLNVQILAFTFKCVPEAYTVFNCIDKSVDPDFIKAISENLATES